MRTALRIIAAALCAAFAGCTAIRVSHVGKSMVEVENNGWFLLNFIPLASGDADNPESKICNLFQNSVTLNNNIDLINYAVKREGAVGVRDLVTYTTDEYVLFIFLKRHCMHTSAVLVMPGDEGGVQKVESRLERTPETAEVVTAPKLAPKRPAAPIRSESRDTRPADVPKLKILDF